jgi:alanine racemase
VIESLASQVADIRHLGAGESTGYCRSFIASEPCTVGLIPVGYADGIRRSLANHGEVLVNGTRCRMVGNVSMDHFSVLIPDTTAIGDEVVLIGERNGERISIEDHARWAGTINYEIACGIATEPRLQRALREPQRS